MKTAVKFRNLQIKPIYICIYLHIYTYIYIYIYIHIYMCVCHISLGDRKQRQQRNFSRNVRGKHQKTKVIKTELLWQNKTKLIKQKEKINKTSYIQLFKYIYTTYLYLYIGISSWLISMSGTSGAISQQLNIKCKTL